MVNKWWNKKQIDDFFKRGEFKKKKTSTHSHTVGYQPVWQAGRPTSKEALIHLLM